MLQNPDRTLFQTREQPTLRPPEVWKDCVMIGAVNLSTPNTRHAIPFPLELDVNDQIEDCYDFIFEIGENTYQGYREILTWGDEPYEASRTYVLDPSGGKKVFVFLSISFKTEQGETIAFHNMTYHLPNNPAKPSTPKTIISASSPALEDLELPPKFYVPHNNRSLRQLEAQGVEYPDRFEGLDGSAHLAYNLYNTTLRNVFGSADKELPPALQEWLRRS